MESVFWNTALQNQEEVNKNERKKPKTWKEEQKDKARRKIAKRN